MHLGLSMSHTHANEIFLRMTVFPNLSTASPSSLGPSQVTATDKGEPCDGGLKQSPVILMLVRVEYQTSPASLMGLIECISPSPLLTLEVTQGYSNAASAAASNVLSSTNALGMAPQRVSTYESSYLASTPSLLFTAKLCCYRDLVRELTSVRYECLLQGVLVLSRAWIETIHEARQGPGPAE